MRPASVWWILAPRGSGARQRRLISTKKYLDGRIVSTANCSFAMSATNRLRVASSAVQPSETPFNGSIADVRVYARALTGAGVVSLSLPLLPTLPFASTPTATLGATSYEYFCARGYYGQSASVTLTAGNVSAGLSAMRINCTGLPLLTYKYTKASSYSTCPSSTACLRRRHAPPLPPPAPLTRPSTGTPDAVGTCSCIADSFLANKQRETARSDVTDDVPDRLTHSPHDFHGAAAWGDTADSDSKVRTRAPLFAARAEISISITAP